ncbi:MAG: GNAT family N-acetyltransferase [Actinomycetota bacterium]|nr:GNAT family N-acetyltransferase [Actinomycetota bacterium]
MVDIARLGEQDWAVYRDVRLASLEEAPFAFGSRLAAERDRTEAEWRDRLEHRTQFVAREEGRPVATVGYLAEAEGLELVSMWVAPPVRGTGVADLLVDAVVADAGDRGCETIVVWVSEGNEPAERFYVRHGFVRTGRVQPVDVDHPVRGVEFEMLRVDPPR